MTESTKKKLEIFKLTNRKEQSQSLLCLIGLHRYVFLNSDMIVFGFKKDRYLFSNYRICERCHKLRVRSTERQENLQ